MLDGWVSSVGLDSAGYGTHSMRRTKAWLIYHRTKNLRALQLLLGHSKLESTVKYPASRSTTRSGWPSRLPFDQRPLYRATAPAARPAQFGHKAPSVTAAQPPF